MLNNISIMGYMVRDPDLRATLSGGSVCKFTIANTRPKTAKGEREVDFIEVIAADRKAEFVKKWFKKGDPIVVIGRLQSQVVVDTRGRSTKNYEILASMVDFVPKTKEKDDSQFMPD